MQKTLDILLREQRERIAAKIMASYEPQENDEQNLWGRALDHAIRIVLDQDGQPEHVHDLGTLDEKTINNVIRLPTRTRPSDTRG
jgi:Txe/YoeB family toxin of Txe-Axe toxin-antitoxin module